MNRRTWFGRCAAVIAGVSGLGVCVTPARKARAYVRVFKPRRLPRMTYQEVYDEYMRDGHKRVAFIRERDAVRCPPETKICDGPNPDIDGEPWVTIHHPGLPPTAPGEVIPVVNTSLRQVVTRPIWPNHKEIEAMYRAASESKGRAQ